MRIQLTNLQIRVVASGQQFGADLSFQSGLNIVRADNSAGKSTCMNSILWALGLDGMLGPRNQVPLPHAMTSEIEGPDGTMRTVTESHVTLEIQRSDDKACLTIRRHVTGSIDKSLVNTWDGPLLSEPHAYYKQRDYYVRRPGAAQEERGFHRFLAEWCGWEMPTVTSFDGSPMPLYLEAVAPLWIVEQKRGWSGIQAVTPQYLRISEVRKRALEYVLALDVLGRRASIQQLRQDLQELRGEWGNRLAAFTAIAQQVGATARLPRQPTGNWPPTPAPALLISHQSQWIPIRKAIQGSVDHVDSLSRRSRSREAVSAQLSADLDATEAELELAMAARAQLRRSMVLDRESLEQARHHLAAIEQDKRRHKDLLLLRKLGSDEGSLLRTEACPVCNRDLGDVLLNEDSRSRVMGIEETVQHLDAQADLSKAVIESSVSSLEAREAQMNALARRARELRSRISAHRIALLGDGPSIAEAEELLAARRRLKRFERTEREFAGVCSDLAELSNKWRTTEARLRELRSRELSEIDKRTLDELQRTFLSQLSSYGFESLSPHSMKISQSSYHPDHEGYDAAFESSASDVIRIIWAYLLSLLHVSRKLGLNHPGLVIFDEPRQQMASGVSFRELLRRAVAIGGQVVFATSETEQRLARMLEGLSPNLISFEGKILKPLQTSITSP